MNRKSSTIELKLCFHDYDDGKSDNPVIILDNNRQGNNILQ